MPAKIEETVEHAKIRRPQRLHSSGARLFAKIHIGNNVAIGANAVVYKDVPDDAIVVLDPGFRIISRKGNRKLELAA